MFQNHTPMFGTMYTDKEVSTSIEFGSKMEFFDNRLRVNTSVFSTDVEDNQFFEFYAGPFGLMRVVTTIEDLQIQGFEMDFNAVRRTRLRLVPGIGFAQPQMWAALACRTDVL